MIDLPKKYDLPVKAVLSLFGIGFIPLSPGTLASIVVTVFFSFTFRFTLSYLHIVLIIIFLIVLYLISVRLIKLVIKPPIDKSWIVVDEVIGMTITLLPVFVMQKPQLLLPALISFRFFDIVKPLTIKYIDSLHSPSSVILDDVLSGLVSAFLMILLGFYL